MVTPDLADEEDVAKLIIPDDLSDEQSTFKAYIEAKVYDKAGHIIQHHRQPMRSLTQWFLALITIPLLGTYQGPSVNTAQAILTNVLGMPSQQSSYPGSATANWDWSIVLGSGTQSFSPTLNSLAAPIANGSGAGQLVYGSISVSYAGTSIFVSVTVTNYTSSSISVTEIGLYANIYVLYAGFAYNTYSFLLSYDTFSTPISIPPNGLATFQITLSFTG